LAYRKPILIEILAETHLHAGTLPESAFFDIVPVLKERGFTQVELGEAGLSVEIEASGEPRARQKPRVRCWRTDRKALVQIAEDLMVTNLTGLYPGWNHFRELYGTSVDALRTALPNAAYESLNLITVDRFEVPAIGFKLGSYLRCGGTYIPSWYEDANEPIDITLGRGFLRQQGRNRVVKVKVRILGDKARVDLEAVFHERVPAEPVLFAMLETLHDESTSAFEAMITDRTRHELMEGTK